jgi:hypothetical protein
MRPEVTEESEAGSVKPAKGVTGYPFDGHAGYGGDPPDPEGQFMRQVAERMSEAVYEPGVYARHDDMESSEITVQRDGSLTLEVSRSVPNEDRITVKVTFEITRRF